MADTLLDRRGVLLGGAGLLVSAACPVPRSVTVDDLYAWAGPPEYVIWEDLWPRRNGFDFSPDISMSPTPYISLSLTAAEAALTRYGTGNPVLALPRRFGGMFRLVDRVLASRAQADADHMEHILSMPGPLHIPSTAVPSRVPSPHAAVHEVVTTSVMKKV